VCRKKFVIVLSLFLPLVFGVALVRSVAAQESPAGDWSPRFDEDQFERIPGPEIGDYLAIPINDAARRRGDTWDAALIELPENQCREHGADYGWRGPSNLRIWPEIDQVSQKVIAYHTHLGAYGAEMTIWMDGRPHPGPNAPHTWEGFSTGVWDGDILTVTTTHLKENWLRRNGLDRSDLGTVTIRFLRHENYLTVTVIVYDPVYLTEPFIRTTDFAYNPQQQMAPWPCIPVDEVDRAEGVIPAHLPGKNTFLNEFPAAHGIPYEAARGGAEETYPEYQLKLKTMPRLPRPVKKAAGQ
jgi:hypothetical protein